MQPTFTGTIQNGTLKLDRPEQFKKHLSLLKSKYIVITVKPKRKMRTCGRVDEKSNQNGYYWAVVIPVLADQFGYNPDEMHQALKHKFLRIGGTDELPKIRSTASLSAIEWENLMEQIRIWALSEYDINIPTVEDYYNGLIN